LTCSSGADGLAALGSATDYNFSIQGGHGRDVVNFVILLDKHAPNVEAIERVVCGSRKTQFSTKKSNFARD
jgi:hypothetical protein